MENPFTNNFGQQKTILGYAISDVNAFEALGGTCTKADGRFRAVQAVFGGCQRH
jgi:hypothetical protein